MYKNGRSVLYRGENLTRRNEFFCDVLCTMRVFYGMANTFSVKKELGYKKENIIIRLYKA